MERRGDNRLLCTCRAPDHIQMPRSWPPILLISALYSVRWREGNRREEEEEEKTEKRGEKRERREKREQERERRELREKKQNSTKTKKHTTHHNPHNTQHPHSASPTPTQHHMHTHNPLTTPLTSQPTVILRRKSECLDTRTSNTMTFLFLSVTTVTPVTPVIFLRIYCFRFNIKL